MVVYIDLLVLAPVPVVSLYKLSDAIFSMCACLRIRLKLGANCGPVGSGFALAQSIRTSAVELHHSKASVPLVPLALYGVVCSGSLSPSESIERTG